MNQEATAYSFETDGQRRERVMREAKIAAARELRNKLATLRGRRREKFLAELRAVAVVPVPGTNSVPRPMRRGQIDSKLFAAHAERAATIHELLTMELPPEPVVFVAGHPVEGLS